MLFHKIRIVSLAVLVIGSVSGVAGAIVLRAAQAPARPGANDPGGVASSEVTTTIQRSESVDPRRVLPLRKPGDPLPSPFRGKNHPNLADRTDPIPSFGLGSIVLVKSPDGRSYEAWSDDVDPDATGGWQRLTIPESVKLTPLCTLDTLAFAYTGKTIDEIAAFSATHGRWERVKLRMPVEESLEPLMGNGFALYQAANVLYAFSAEKGGWAILELPADATDQSRTSWTEKHLLVQQGKRLYAFSLKQGKWSMPVEVELPTAKPK